MVTGLSIRKKLILIIILATVISSGSGYAIFVTWHIQNQHNQLIDYSRTVADVLAQDFARMVLLNDVSVAADVSAKLDGFQLVRVMVLYDDHSAQAVYQYRVPELTSQDIPPLPDKENRNAYTTDGDLALFLPAVYRGFELGTIYLQIKQSSLREIIKRDSIALLGIGFLSLLLALLLALWFEAGFNAPLLRLVAFLQQINRVQGESVRITSAEHNEMGQVFQAVNSMLDRIDASNAQLRLAAVAFETQDGIVITDSQERILKVNQAFTRITGYTQEEVLGKTPAVLHSGRHNAHFYRQMHHSLAEHGRWSGEVWNRRKSGEIYPEWLIVQVVRDAAGALSHYVGIFTDLTHIKSVEQQLDYLGKYDSLTGLANRRLLNLRLQDSAQQLSKEEHLGAVLCLDLNNFKLVNDTYGHDAGDLALLELASRLRALFVKDAILARLGGDVFVVVLERLGNDKHRATLRLESMLENMLEALEKPYPIGDGLHSFATSIGIMLYPSEDLDSTALIKNAEVALHQAKRSTSVAWHFFDPDAERIARHYLTRQRELQQALAQQQFVVYYQSQHDQQREPVGAEALIRWQHPEEGLKGAFDIIPVAEQSGLIIAIGEWVLRSVCEQLVHWQADPQRRDWVVSVNYSPLQFEQEDCVAKLARILQETQAPPQRLNVELTESMLMNNVDAVAEKMYAFRDLGVQLSLDDFGTGYSSLLYLKKLPFSQIKIDQGFVKNMTTSPSDIAIIKSILSLGDAFGMEVIAEGVETEAHFQQLRSLGCLYFQGFLFARPVPVTAIPSVTARAARA